MYRTKPKTRNFAFSVFIFSKTKAYLQKRFSSKEFQLVTTDLQFNSRDIDNNICQPTQPLQNACFQLYPSYFLELQGFPGSATKHCSVLHQWFSPDNSTISYRFSIRGHKFDQFPNQKTQSDARSWIHFSLSFYLSSSLIWPSLI